jgi:hypothetical protein
MGRPIAVMAGNDGNVHSPFCGGAVSFLPSSSPATLGGVAPQGEAAEKGAAEV